MKSLSLFSGIGGIELALSQIGIEPVAFCDLEKYCQQILGRRWPEVPVFGDVKELDIAQLEASGVPVDDIKIITGGYPCQSHSVAGKRKGRDDERHLWPEMFRLIQSISPDYIIGENVEGLLSSSEGTVFGDVLRDMSSLGYRVGWCCYPASDIGCAHERYRVFSFGLRETHSGWMPDKTVVMDAVMAWLAYAKWPALPGYKQRVYEPPRVIFEDTDKDRSKRVKAIGNAVSPMQIFPIALALMCRGDIEYIDFSGVEQDWLEACVNVRMFDKKLAVLEECFRLVRTVIEQPIGKTFAHLDNNVWHTGPKPFVGKPGQQVSKWKKWGYVSHGTTCIDYKHNFNTTTLRAQFPPYLGDRHHGSEQWRDMDDALWRTPTSECGVKITSLMDKEGNPPSKLGVTTYRRNKDGTVAVQSVTLNQQVAMCHEWESALWATPQANTTAGELPEHLVNSKGEEPKPGEKMYRRDSGRMVQTALTTQVKMWPGESDVAPDCPISILWPRPSTHNSSEVTDCVYSPNKTSDTIERTARSASGKRAMMNPDWEEVLMGFPVGWTKSNL